MAWEKIWAEIRENHRGKTVGALVGLVFGLLLAIIGFWRTIAVMFFVLLGYTIGKSVDNHGNIAEIWRRIFKEW